MSWSCEYALPRDIEAPSPDAAGTAGDARPYHPVTPPRAVRSDPVRTTGQRAAIDTELQALEAQGVRFPLRHLRPEEIGDSERWEWPEGTLVFERRHVIDRGDYLLEVPLIRFTDRRGRTSEPAPVDWNGFDPRTLHLGDFDGDGSAEVYLTSLSSVREAEFRGGGVGYFRVIAQGLAEPSEPFGLECATGLLEPSLPAGLRDAAQRLWRDAQRGTVANADVVEARITGDFDGDGEAETLEIISGGERSDCSEVPRRLWLRDGRSERVIAEGRTLDYCNEVDECECVHRLEVLDDPPIAQHLDALRRTCIWGLGDPRCPVDATSSFVWRWHEASREDATPTTSP